MISPALVNVDPFRSKCWRWDRVLQIVDNKPRPLRCKQSDDEFIRACRAFTLKRRSFSNPKSPELFQEHPGLYVAFLINDSTHLERKDVIEARILSRQPAREIAHETGTSEEGVIWYEKIFFNVLDRLDATDWIVHEVLGPHMDTDYMYWEGNESALTLKFFAWAGGPEMLNFMLTMTNRAVRPQSYDECVEFVDNNWQDTIKARSLQAARVFGINKFNVADLFATHARILELQKATDTGQQSRNLLEGSVAAMLKNLPYRIGRVGEQELEGTMVGDFDKLPVEARDHELLFLAAEQTPSSLDGFEGFHIPDAVDSDERLEALKNAANSAA